MSGADIAALSFAAALILTMPVFAIVSRGRAVDPEVVSRGKTILLGRWIRDWLMWVIGPFERGMIRAGVTPTALNFIGAAFGFAAGVAFSFSALGTAGLLIMLGGVADVFDGRIARARGMVSSFGAFLDSTLDRFSESFSLLGLMVYFAAAPLLVFVTAAAMSGSLLVSYTKARGESLGVQSPGGLMQRAERLVLLAVGAIADPFVASRTGWTPGTVLGGVVAVIALGTWGTACYRLYFIGRALLRAEPERPAPPDSRPERR